MNNSYSWTTWRQCLLWYTF